MTTPKVNLWLAHTLATSTFQFPVSDIFKEPLREGRTRLKEIILKAEIGWIYEKEKRSCLFVIAGTWNKDVGNYFVTKNVMVIP